MTPRISAIVISRNEGDRLRQTVAGLRATLPGNSEILVVDDGSEDGSADAVEADRCIRTPCLGITHAKNLGARSSSGEILLFCDAHLTFAPDWWEPVYECLSRPRAGAAAPAIGDQDHPDAPFGCGFTLPSAKLDPEWLNAAGPHPFHAPILPGACLAMPRPVFDRLGGFDPGMRARGRTDAEIGLRCWLFGYENWVAPQSKVWHHFRRVAPFRVSSAEMLHNRLRLALVYFRPDRIATVLSAYQNHFALANALRLTSPEVLERRRAIGNQRIYTDSWFFAKFGIAWAGLSEENSPMTPTTPLFSDDEMRAIEAALRAASLSDDLIERVIDALTGPSSTPANQRGT